MSLVILESDKSSLGYLRRSSMRWSCETAALCPWICRWKFSKIPEIGTTFGAAVSIQVSGKNVGIVFFSIRNSMEFCMKGFKLLHHLVFVGPNL